MDEYLGAADAVGVLEGDFVGGEGLEDGREGRGFWELELWGGYWGFLEVEVVGGLLVFLCSG